MSIHNIKKVGCTNVAIALTLVGIIPLLAGLSGLAKEIVDPGEGLTHVQLATALLMTVLGLAACGYRSCLYLHRGYGVFVRKMLGFTFKEETFNYSDFDHIYVGTFWSMVSEGSSSMRFYDITFVGRSESVDIGDFIRFRKNVGHPKSFAKIQSLAHQMASISGLKVCYSDEVKELNDLTD
ncbi:hypothetical protein [Marinimicrobium locisalis]|uniref:hypothetical protein n=1 Tax=Marinimicrobium locisalis TaxID=546022 RepID=UPI003221AD60